MLFYPVNAVLLVCAVVSSQPSPGPFYPWRAVYDPANALSERIAPPKGFARAPLAAGSFAAWLRGLPLKPGRPAVLLYDGSKKRNQEAHVAVIDIDVGSRDLQQCADFVIRLRGEYAFAMNTLDQLSFRFESGDEARFSAWAQGMRPQVQGSVVTWKKAAAPASDYRALVSYLTTVFQYASTRSLIRELVPVPTNQPPEIGDVLIAAGSPGHAVIVVDKIINTETGEVAYLLAQSYMPAQEPHVLKSFDDISPWYRATDADEIVTPEWKFKRSDWRR